MKPRLKALFSLVIITAAGFALKLYSGPFDAWANNYLAGAVYEIFWVVFLFMLFPRPRFIPHLCLFVFLITSLLEFTQLSSAPVLESIRSSFIGRALIGSTFSRLDFPHYALGCLAGFGVLKTLKSRQ